ncbi:MAG TPA: hypothetical protein VJ570_13425, partial [Holophagaceae bacterium]|nr:hypothetical protein [Holophagaceae bacterium]
MILIRSILALGLSLMAQAPAGPEPSVEAVLARLEAKSAATRALGDAYGYVERVHMRVLDSKGMVKKEETKEYEVTPIHGKSVKRLLKVDGKPLDEKAAAKEDARVLQEAEKASADESGSVRQVGVRALMKFWKVKGIRRAEWQGREALVLDFEPRPKTSPKGKSEEAASKLAGALFLAPESLDLLHLDAHLVDSLSVFGFLGSVQAGGTLTQDFRLVNGELFMPAKAVARFPTRALFSHVVVELDTVWSDFQKFGMDASSV